MTTHYDGYVKANTDDPKWFLLIHLYELLVSIDYTPPETDVNTLEPESIVIVKSDREKHLSQVYANLPKPGIMIVSRESRDTPSGNNGEDDVVYTYHVFLIDKDYDQKIKGLRSWMRWQWLIQRKLRYNDVSSGLKITNVFDAPFFEVSSMETLEDIKWDTDDLVRAGLVVRVLSRETRNHG